MSSLENLDNYIEQLKSDDEIHGEIVNLAEEKIKFSEWKRVETCTEGLENAITLHSIVVYTRDETGNRRKHKQAPARSIVYESGGDNIIRNILTNK